jgi:hypothetical protein
MKFCVSPDRLIPACRRLALHYIDCPSVSIGSDDCYDLNERYWDDQLQSKLSQLLTYLLQHKRATDLTRLIVCNVSQPIFRFCYY